MSRCRNSARRRYYSHRAERSSRFRNIVSEPELRAEIVPILLPKSTQRTVGRDGNTRVADLLKEVWTGTEIEVGVQPGVLVVLDSEVLPAHTKIERQPAGQLPLIRPVECEFVVAIAPRKGR